MLCDWLVDVRAGQLIEVNVAAASRQLQPPPPPPPPPPPGPMPTIKCTVVVAPARVASEVAAAAGPEATPAASIGGTAAPARHGGGTGMAAAPSSAPSGAGRKVAFTKLQTFAVRKMDGSLEGRGIGIDGLELECVDENEPEIARTPIFGTGRGGSSR